MRSDPKALIEMAAGGVPANHLVEGKYASKGFYITVDADKAVGAMRKLDLFGIDYEHMKKTPVKGVQALAFASKADRDKALKKLGLLSFMGSPKVSGVGESIIEEGAEEKVARLLAVMAEKFTGMKIKDIRDILQQMGDKDRGGDPKHVAKFAKAFNEFYKVWKEYERYWGAA